MALFCQKYQQSQTSVETKIKLQLYDVTLDLKSKFLNNYHLTC